MLLNSTMNSFDIIVFLCVREGTSQTLLKKNCELWTREGAKIKLLLPRQYQVNIRACEGSNVEKLYGIQLNETISRVVKPGSTFASASKWYLVQDAHEIIIPPPNIAGTFTSIRDFITKATIGPNEFNAISLSTMYMTNENGSPQWGNGMPFKAHSPGPWDKWTKNKADRQDFRPKVDTLLNTVKMWKHTDRYLTISMQRTQDNHHVFSGVSFTGRRVYPYTLVSMRYKPTADVSYDSIGRISEKTYMMYGYYLYMGYWNYARRDMLETSNLY